MQNNISKILLTLVFSIATCFTPVFSQGNLNHIDDRIFHFGFSLGFNTMDFRIGESLQEIDGEVWHAEISTLTPGFSVGIITDLRLSRYLNLRCTPTLNFAERKLTYITGEDLDRREYLSISSIPVQLPLYLKYSSERLGNMRPYLIGGGGLSVDLGRNKEKPVYLNPFDYFVEVGAGCDIYFPFFKLAPELKIGMGFNDLLATIDPQELENMLPSDRKYSMALSRLRTKMITLTFNFE